MVIHVRKTEDGAIPIPKYTMVFLVFLARVEHRALWIARCGDFNLHPHCLVRHHVGENVID